MISWAQIELTVGLQWHVCSKGLANDNPLKPVVPG